MASEDVDIVARWVQARVTPQDWEHVQSVARLAESDDERMAALAHDIYEDGIVTEAELRAVAPANVADAVVILARRPDETYTAYIERVASADNPLASAVKIYDLMDHLMPRRSAHYRNEARRAKRERYLWALGEIHGEVVWQLDREQADGE